MILISNHFLIIFLATNILFLLNSTWTPLFYIHINRRSISTPFDLFKQRSPHPLITYQHGSLQPPVHCIWICRSICKAPFTILSIHFLTLHSLHMPHKQPTIKALPAKCPHQTTTTGAKPASLPTANVSAMLHRPYLLTKPTLPSAQRQQEKTTHMHKHRTQNTQPQVLLQQVATTLPRNQANQLAIQQLRRIQGISRAVDMHKLMLSLRVRRKEGKGRALCHLRRPERFVLPLTQLKAEHRLTCITETP